MVINWYVNGVNHFGKENEKHSQAGLKQSRRELCQQGSGVGVS